VHDADIENDDYYPQMTDAAYEQPTAGSLTISPTIAGEKGLYTFTFQFTFGVETS